MSFAECYVISLCIRVRGCDASLQLGVGQFFGELALLEPDTRSSSVSAISSITITVTITTTITIAITITITITTPSNCSSGDVTVRR